MANSIVTVSNQVRGFARMPLERQIGLIVALVAAITLVASIFLWLTRPSYTALYPNLNEQETAQVADALARNGVGYRLEGGTVKVPARQMHEARLKLATEGLPRASGFGFELLEQDQGLGTSRLIEDARYHRAIEGELARSIATLNSVESARVHLALPRQSVFVRDRAKPSASVLVNLFAGRSLDDNRVAGIVHLVASSVPELDPENVTVVDQRGRLLTAPSGGADNLGGNGHQLDFTRRVEESYVRRIMDILSPIMGSDAVRAQVAADLDFSAIERTVEAYDPEFSVLRSEQISEDESRGGGNMGIPGALTNQPPEAGVADGNEVVNGNPVGNMPGSNSRRTVRNYEVDRTISHIREAPGSLRRLSVAVVVDHRQETNAQGQIERVALSEEELERINTLVREAVGFDARRGDSVNVVNASFRPTDVPEPLPEPPLWEEPWVMDMAKTILAVIMVLVLALTVVRPLLRNLAEKGAAAHREEQRFQQLALEAGEAVPGLEHQSQGALPGPARKNTNYEANLESARGLVREDPKRVAQMMKTWIATDGSAG
ncbi:flagellar M-ring protein FliF [Thioalkalivibrio denitrificans]|uniref:Flagellar M-ring protein n=1 Tax=Thioalkalivibrio denitrificans TaxID=108003 RepID=A0A1V3NMA6_9GAMM|nr:flagellar basal-body MS-ring/collar protein FliF [Thioalkalivibrio denitrificans]OOG26190.1 flagellar M-ring protein FliF [Thioalkalivibrio denitrificans]